MNCSFDNPKSSGFFPRSHNEEECGTSLNCMRNTGGMYLGVCSRRLQRSVCEGVEEQKRID